MPKTKKIKHKTSIAVTANSNIAGSCLCGWSGTSFLQIDNDGVIKLADAISSASNECDDHQESVLKSK